MKGFFAGCKAVVISPVRLTAALPLLSSVCCCTLKAEPADSDILGRRSRVRPPAGVASLGAWVAAAVILLSIVAPAAHGADSGSLQISKAWTPPAEVGADSPLLMTIRNNGTEVDSLLRARCPVANFLEKHTVDRGEGAPAMRAVASIPVPPNRTVTLSMSGYHLMLLQTRQPLAVGDRFACSVAFAKAGTLDVDVQVAPGEPGP
jgi:periplasmic copper chaperone A